ncbi:hypothetical protein [Nostoc sp. NZL]|uniref:hypothetical protein n=1 Tax=Nostoc sp. NZL TaxID=2650612 RepID=UPI0018C69652|nr:hypothetical protein [Nostoc sp. NZL]MBG1243863.1 hypothetical protein [Nostoc sp. NZL]
MEVQDQLGFKKLNRFFQQWTLVSSACLRNALNKHGLMFWSSVVRDLDNCPDSSDLLQLKEEYLREQLDVFQK